MTSTPATTKRNWFARHPLLTLAIALAWVVLTIVSNRVDRATDEARLRWGQTYMDEAGAITVPVPGDGLAVSVESFDYRVVRTHAALGSPEGCAPILLLHGTPGGASGFAQLAPELARLGHDAIWLDLPGFASQAEPPSRGSVFEDYSAQTYARILWRVLDEMDVDRAHVLGWSNGGAVALRMIEQQPDRVPSLTLLGSVGAQETEGSGSYWFEHAKYALGDLLLVKAAPFYPHFGIAGPASDRHAFIRNFDDTDQRPLGPLMSSLETPTLILHGRADFLVSDWAAERHYEMMPTSSLVMTPYEHFMPFLQPRETAAWISPFLSRHDTPGVEPETSMVDLAPRSQPFGAIGEAIRSRLHTTPWFVLVALGAIACAAAPRVSGATLALLVGAVEVDFGVAVAAMVGGGAIRLIAAREAFDIRRWLAVFVKPALVLLLGMVFIRIIARPLDNALGGFGWFISLSVLVVTLFVLRHAWTALGRRRILASVQRVYRYEFWPAWLFYLPIAPLLVLKGLRHKPMSLTCCNPGISELSGGIGGGIVGESKAAIQYALPEHESVLRTVLIKPGAQAVQHTLDAIESYPVVLKPDAGQRGFGVRVARTEADARNYATKQTVPFVVQAYHPGPHECGVFWVRDHANPNTGSIFGITAKVFPLLQGDGKRSLERLVWIHPRFFMQAETILERFDSDRSRVLEAGESLQLSQAGNHAQGTLFKDGSHLITTQLTAIINELALGFKGTEGGGFDIGRFDLRYSSDDELRAGRGFGIVELNGVTAEASHLYDPSKNILWAYSVLLQQWEHTYRLGAMRRGQGVRPARVTSLIKAMASHYTGRGSLRVSS